MNSRRFVHSLLLASSLASVSACAGPTDDELVVENDGDVALAADLDGKTDQVTLPFTIVDDADLDVPDPKPVRKVFKTAKAYRDYFGHDAPDVSFGSEWVAYYSAGLLTSDGHTTSILSIDYSSDARRLDVVTALETPGPGCDSHALPEVPFVLVKFEAPAPKPLSVRFYREDSLRDCTTTTVPGPIAADCTVRTGGAFVTLENVNEESERFVAWISKDAVNPDNQEVFIDEAKRLLADGEQRVPSFKVIDGTDCDGRWGWHVDAVDASFADFTIEICDAVPSYIQQNKAEWLAKGLRWCPWGAKVIAVDDRR